MDNTSEILRTGKRYKIKEKIYATFVSGIPGAIEETTELQEGTVIQPMHIDKFHVIALDISSGNTKICRLNKSNLNDKIDFFECDLWKRAIYQKLYENRELFKIENNLNVISDFIDGEKFQNIPSAIEITDYILSSVKNLMLEDLERDFYAHPLPAPVIK